MEEFEVHDSTEAMKKVMQFVDWDELTIPQKWIISQIVNYKKKRREIAEIWFSKKRRIYVSKPLVRNLFVLHSPNHGIKE